MAHLKAVVALANPEPVQCSRPDGNCSCEGNDCSVETDLVNDQRFAEHDHYVAELERALEEGSDSPMFEQALAWKHGDHSEIVLAEIARVSAQLKKDARYQRQLLAYAREFMGRRPFTLADLAEATGMSISGVRISYNQSDIDEVSRQLGTPVPNKGTSDD